MTTLDAWRAPLRALGGRAASVRAAAVRTVAHGSARERVELLVAVLAVAATTALLLTLGFSRLSPAFLGDEIGYLANAIEIGGGPVLEISADSYYPGWSLVLVPAWLVLHQPLAFYRVAVLLSALSGVALIPVLAALGRRLGLRRTHSATAAAAVAALPAHALMSGFALAESFLELVVGGAVVLALVASGESAAGSRRAPRWFAAAGATAGFAFVVHGRLAPMVVATLLWAVALVIRRRWREGVALAVPTVLVAGLGYLLYHHLEVTLYRSTGRESDGVLKLFASQPVWTALTASGELWTVVVATAGLAIPGVVLLAGRIGAEVRGRAPGWALWAALWIAGLAAISITYVTNSVSLHQRLDLYVYGRYLEPATGVVAFLGACLLVREATGRVDARARAEDVTRTDSAGRDSDPAQTVGRGRARHLLHRPSVQTIVMLDVCAVVLLGYGIVAAQFVPPASKTVSGWNAMNVFGLAQYTWHTGRDTVLPTVQAGLVTFGMLLLFVIMRRIVRTPSAFLACLAAFALASTLLGQVRTVVPAYGYWQHAFTLTATVDRVERLDPTATVSFDTAPPPLRPGESAIVSQNAYQFVLAPTVVPVVDSSRRMPTTDLVISRQTWARGQDAGWRLLGSDPSRDDAVWVRPGALERRLEAAGILPPAP